MSLLSDRARSRTTTAAFTEVQVARIKRQLLNGASPRALALAYSCSTETIRKMGRGDTWNWVLPEAEIPLNPSDPPVNEQELQESLARFQKIMEEDK